MKGMQWTGQQLFEIFRLRAILRNKLLNFVDAPKGLFLRLKTNTKKIMEKAERRFRLSLAHRY